MVTDTSISKEWLNLSVMDRPTTGIYYAMLESYEFKIASNGENFISMRFSDVHDDQIQGRMFSLPNQTNLNQTMTAVCGKIVKLEATFEFYKTQRNLIIERIEAIAPELQERLKAESKYGKIDYEALLSTLKEKIISKLTTDNQRSFFRQYCKLNNLPDYTEYNLKRGMILPVLLDLVDMWGNRNVEPLLAYLCFIGMKSLISYDNLENADEIKLSMIAVFSQICDDIKGIELEPIRKQLSEIVSVKMGFGNIISAEVKLLLDLVNSLLDFHNISNVLNKKTNSTLFDSDDGRWRYRR